MNLAPKYKPEGEVEKFR